MKTSNVALFFFLSVVAVVVTATMDVIAMDADQRLLQQRLQERLQERWDKLEQQKREIENEGYKDKGCEKHDGKNRNPFKCDLKCGECKRTHDRTMGRYRQTKRLEEEKEQIKNEMEREERRQVVRNLNLKEDDYKLYISVNLHPPLQVLQERKGHYTDLYQQQQRKERKQQQQQQQQLHIRGKWIIPGLSILAVYFSVIISLVFWNFKKQRTSGKKSKFKTSDLSITGNLTSVS